MRVSYAKLSDLTGKAYRTLKKAIEGLEPVGTSRTKANLWESKEALPLIYGVGSVENKLDGAAEKARLDKARRVGQELKNKQMEGDLVPVEDVGMMFARIITAAKTKFLGIKSKVAPLLYDSLDDMELADAILSLIEQQSREVLTELSIEGQLGHDRNNTA